MKADDFFKLINKYLIDANAEMSANVKNKDSFIVHGFDIFEIGQLLFENDLKNKLSIDRHLGKNESSDESGDDDSDGSSESSSTEEDDEDEEEREAITSLDKAVNAHNVTMLLLKKTHFRT